jgi:uncharacterized Zn finger protein/superfamily II DNA or RNA helicase
MSYGYWGFPRKKKVNRKKSAEPRKRIKFGQTWWGEQWLNALSHIDYDNRLPRGRVYAGNGSVQDIQIKGNIISARVQGSRSTPYKVKVEIPLMNPQHQEKLVESVLNNPLMLSRLLNREMPQEMVRVAKDLEIPIFPRVWKDLEMKCSCPDWAVPCKHLAAVIYLISNEIDANPFILFNLRGLDLIEALKKHHTGIAEHAEEPIPAVESFIVDQLPGGSGTSDFPVSELPDFTTITHQSERIFTLLSSKPLFSDKDFKPILQSLYKTVAKAAITLAPCALDTPIAQFVRKIESFDDTLILLNQKLVVVGVSFIIRGKKRDLEERISWLDFIDLIDNLDQATLERCNKALRGIVLHRRFAIELTARGAMIPQLLVNREKQYLVRWIPAENDPQIKSIAARITGLTQPGKILIWSLVKKGKEEFLPLNPEENSRMLTSAFLNTLVEDSGEVNVLIAKAENTISDLFFLHKPYNFSGLSEKQIPNTIQLWLKPLFRGSRRWQPILRIEDRNGAFYLDILAVDTENAIQTPVMISEIIQGDQYKSISLEMLRDLSQLTGFLPDLGFYLQISGRQPMQYNSNEFYDVFQRVLPILRLLGIGILMPKELEKLLVPKTSLRLTGQKGKIPSYLNLHEILGFEFQVAIGDTVMPVDEFRKLVARLSGIVKIKDQYVLLTNNILEKIFHETSQPAKLSQRQVLQAALSGEYNGASVGLDASVKKLIKKMISVEEIPLPEGITATLRPYQTIGFQWMVQQSKIGFGSLIADDMGLGKTLQVIAVLLKFKQEGLLENTKALIIVPTTLLTNWQKEVEKFAPALRTMVYHGAARKLDLKSADLLLTTYGMVRSDLKTLKAQNWHTVVIDEAQNIKNSTADQTKAVKSLKSTIRIAMSGTPVENRLSEYWSIMDFVYPGYLGSSDSFAKEFANPIQLSNDQHKAGIFRKITAPFILRRLKTDKSIISDLPDKVEINRFCSLTGEQAALYQNMVDQALKSIEEADGIQRRGLVLKMITTLKQVCNHPDNFLKKGKADPALSGKSVMLMELLESILEAGEKSLIFTQYREMGDILVPMIEKQFGTTPLFLHGGTSRKQRDELVEAFQQNRHTRFFILSLKAGGTGLNLTSANHVIHYDFWWNPAVEAQATDRAYRIGQHKNVMVNRLLTRGTFEEKIDEMLRNKKELANLTVATGEQWIGELPDKDLKAIFNLGK